MIISPKKQIASFIKTNYPETTLLVEPSVQREHPHLDTYESHQSSTSLETVVDFVISSGGDGECCLSRNNASQIRHMITLLFLPRIRHHASRVVVVSKGMSSHPQLLHGKLWFSHILFRLRIQSCDRQYVQGRFFGDTTHAHLLQNIRRLWVVCGRVPGGQRHDHPQRRDDAHPKPRRLHQRQISDLCVRRWHHH